MTLKVIKTSTIRKLPCGFLFAFHSNYGSILHHLRDRAIYFSNTLAFGAPVRGSPSEYCRPVWCETINRMVRLPGGGKNVEDMYNRLDTIPACDGQTDRQTDRHLATT